VTTYQVLNRLLTFLQSRPKAEIVALLLVLLAGMGVVDFMTAIELSFSFFYLVPVALGTWCIGRRAGLFFSTMSTIVWFVGDFASSPSYSTPIVPYWNATVMFGIFVSVTFVLSTLKKTIDEDNALARGIQERFIPAKMPNITGLEFAGAWRPAESVGGDYYDVIPLNDETAMLCIADVSGHGIPSALLMSNFQAAVKTMAPHWLSASEMCVRLNKFVLENTGDDRFITFFCCVLNTRTRQLVYSNAGHCPPVIIRKNGNLLKLEEGGIPIGMRLDFPYNQGALRFEAGDLLLMYTDGVTEASNAQKTLFGEKRLHDALKAHHAGGAIVVCDEILRLVSTFSRGTYQDDVALLAMSAHPIDNALH
jgi:hypothetical protein